MTPSLCVVLHDVAPATRAACERTLRALDEVGPVPLTLLAVPRYHCEPTSAGFERWLAERHAAGDEVALHGYAHQDDGAPEFSQLDMAEALRRLTAGVRWFGRMGLPLQGFVAPGWRMSQGTWEALRFMDLRYTCTRGRLVLLPDGVQLRSRSVVYSVASVWLRRASVVLNRALAASRRRDPLLRLELSPHAVDHPALRRSWQALIESNLRARKALTLAAAAERFRLDSDWDLLGSPPDDDADAGRQASLSSP